MRLILASASVARRRLLSQAGLEHDAIPARIDEEAIRDTLTVEGLSPRDMADSLAEAKARKIAEKAPDAWVIGSDQILDFNGRAFGKAESCEEALHQLRDLRGKTHKLHAAVVLFEMGKPVWRHISTAKLTMRVFSDSYLEDYLDRNWENLAGCVGAYKLEEEGVRLFQRIEGDYFTVLGLPLIELLDYLSMRRVIQG